MENHKLFPVPLLTAWNLKKSAEDTNKKNKDSRRNFSFSFLFFYLFWGGGGVGCTVNYQNLHDTH